jgi:hypothetical protein
MPADVPIRISLPDLTETRPVASPEAPVPDHRHHTLSQFLLSGTIEPAVLFFAPVFESVPQIWASVAHSERMPDAWWNLQSTPRGPPVSIFHA